VASRERQELIVQPSFSEPLRMRSAAFRQPGSQHHVVRHVGKQLGLCAVGTSRSLDLVVRDRLVILRPRTSSGVWTFSTHGGREESCQGKPGTTRSP